MFTINLVVLSGNLTRDPELRHTPSGVAVASLRLAVNERRKVNDEWTDRANYFDVTVWQKLGEFACERLSKGSAVTVQGRLQWREWEAQDGTKRQAVEVIADSLVWGASRGDSGGRGGGGSGSFTAPGAGGGDEYVPAGAKAGADEFRAPGTPDFVPASASDDDIPF